MGGFRVGITKQNGAREEKGLQSISLLSACASRKTVFSAITGFIQEKAFLLDFSQLLTRNNWIVLLYNVS